VAADERSVHLHRTQAGCLNRRFSSAAVISVGALIFAAAMFVLSQVTLTTPFILTAVGFALCGFGAGAIVPGGATVAMRDVPKAVSGAASGVLNAGRQVGTSIGLATLGAISVHAATSQWTSAVASFPANVRNVAAAQAQNVGAGHISTVTATLGTAYHHSAAEAFLHGARIAMAVAGVCLLATALVTWLGLRKPASAG
jgi:MFS transporter, DHA2 family, methylenomycin A resistance protein